MNKLLTDIIYLATAADAGVPDYEEPAIETTAILDSMNAVLGIIASIQDLLLAAAGGLLVMSVIIAGYKYITGDAKGGKSAVIASVVGAIIVILAYVILDTVTKTVTI